MKPRCLAAVLVVLAIGCTTTPANNQPAGESNVYILHAPYGAQSTGSTTRPPRLTVGTSYSDTQLILPWFLNDLIDFVNYR
ncbi:hypothetical protein [Paraburkholderia adhaesiva]|uniref:hypothetical protein n=1 Tax=Paraburkholderia adhaesiva TaxID=2883244 RepID=UPI001F480ABF|nr:hypothetical protein [Paraburkholderia adhaesiva]